MEENKRHSRVEFDDLQGELSGSSNKAARFLDPDKSPRGRNAQDKEARERTFQTQLDLIMLNPDYAIAHTRVSGLIDDAQDKLSAAIDKTAQRIEHLEDVIADMEDRTTKLPDGTPVFRSADGSVRASDGRKLTQAEAVALTNPDNLLSYEQYKAARDALQGARSRQDGLAGKQTIIDDARRRMDDPDNPPSRDELDDIEDDVTEIIRDLESANSLRPKFRDAAFAPADDLLADLDLGDDGINPHIGGQAR
ncbi:MAG: hypothetical protein AAFQ12_05010 [Pseudomonadota bacterium]